MFYWQHDWDQYGFDADHHHCSRMIEFHGNEIITNPLYMDSKCVFIILGTVFNGFDADHQHCSSRMREWLVFLILMERQESDTNLF